MSASSSTINSFVLFICRVSLGVILTTVGYAALFVETDNPEPVERIEEKINQVETVQDEKNSLSAVERRVGILSEQILAVLDANRKSLDEEYSKSENEKISNMLSWVFIVGSFLLGVFLIFGVCTRAVAFLVVLFSLFLIIVVGVPSEFGLGAANTNQLVLISSIGLVLIFQGGGLISFDRIIFPFKAKDDE